MTGKVENSWEIERLKVNNDRTSELQLKYKDFKSILLRCCGFFSTC